MPSILFKKMVGRALVPSRRLLFHMHNSGYLLIQSYFTGRCGKFILHRKTQRQHRKYSLQIKKMLVNCQHSVSKTNFSNKSYFYQNFLPYDLQVACWKFRRLRKLTWSMLYFNYLICNALPEFTPIEHTMMWQKCWL